MDLKKFIHTKLKEFLCENISSEVVDDIYIKYETDDKKAYVDIEKINDYTWHICLIESKRKGAGTEIMMKVISDAKKLGIKKITLTTTEFSGWGFFDKLGFIEDGDNNDPYDIPMVLIL